MGGIAQKLLGCIRQVRQSVRLVQKRSVAAEKCKSAVCSKRMKRKNLGDAACRHTAEKYSDSVFQTGTGIMAVLELFGKAEPAFRFIYKNIMTCNLIKCMCIPVLIEKSLCAEEAADAPDRCIGPEKSAYRKLRINIEDRRKSFIRQCTLGIQRVRHPAVQFRFRLEILQSVIAYGHGEQAAQLLIRSIHICKLVQFLCEEPAQRVVGVYKSVVGSQDLFGNRILEESVSDQVQCDQYAGYDQAYDHETAFGDAHGLPSLSLYSGVKSLELWRLRYSLGVIPVCFLKDLAK